MTENEKRTVVRKEANMSGPRPERGGELNQANWME
jgi:hypothetical protein